MLRALCSKSDRLFSNELRKWLYVTTQASLINAARASIGTDNFVSDRFMAPHHMPFRSAVNELAGHCLFDRAKPSAYTLPIIRPSAEGRVFVLT
jgi:hypothetical protein